MDVFVANFVANCDTAKCLNPINVGEVDKLVERFYAINGNGAGGALHVVLDDANLTDENIERCIASAKQNGDAAGVALGILLRTMTLTERMAMAQVCQCGCSDI
jgi:hypothetical protein